MCFFTALILLFTCCKVVIAYTGFLGGVFWFAFGLGLGGFVLFCHPNILKLGQIIPDFHQRSNLPISAHSTGLEVLLHVRICSNDVHGSGLFHLPPLTSSQV